MNMILKLSTAAGVCEDRFVIFTRCLSVGSIAREVTVAWWVSCRPTWDNGQHQIHTEDDCNKSVVTKIFETYGSI